MESKDFGFQPRASASNIISSLPRTPQPRAPWLMFPGGEENDDPDTRCFFSLAEKKVYKTKDVFQELVDAWCVGSSHGWLVLLDEKATPHLFNPFSKDRIELPPFPSEIKPRVNEDYFVEELRKLFVSKAVLLFGDEEDQYNSKNCTVVIISGWESKLAFFTHGNNTWINPAGAGTDGGYCDIICHKHELYALTDSGHIEVWDFRSLSPKKIVNYRPSGSLTRIDNENFPRDKFSTKCYLVESSGDLLLVNRVIGNFVNSEGMALDEADLLCSEDTQPLVCPYRTKQFSVYRLDCIENTWEKVESLPDRVIFLGGNHSMSLSTWDHQGLESNSIYYTDDNWDQMNEDYLYGGHDLGMFNLADGISKTFSQCFLERIDPPPFWIIPTGRQNTEQP